MNLRSALTHSPQRLATGAFILHSGLGKWNGAQQQAEYVHGAAAGAFPFLKDVPPATFLKALSVGEIVTGALLLVPFVPNRVAGAALTGFSGALLTMYLRTPGDAPARQRVADAGGHGRQQGPVDARDRGRSARRVGRRRLTRRGRRV